MTINDQQPVLTVRGLAKSFGGRTVLSGFDLDVAPGEVVALLGANGSGKSTALKCVVGLVRPDSGEVRVGPVAMVFQQIHLVRRRSALDNVCAGALGRLPLRHSWSPLAFPRDLREEAMACLDRVGLADRAHERVAALSGGQQQRVALARALCQRAAVLLADEPVSALDPSAADKVMRIMTNLARSESIAVAAVLHQPELARRHADRIVGLRDGRIVFSGPAGEIPQEQISALYVADEPAGTADRERQSA
ncbi:phosphonate ABC transporter ATP-binding protein [Streptosporangium sp. G11]|uniref:phosphonate ABC transporter ATP-binding protein n=1 Tax=Streptosporangium sp. G11 TaxID=3436926 RepID=UPI003EB7DE44